MSGRAVFAAVVVALLTLVLIAAATGHLHVVGFPR